MVQTAYTSLLVNSWEKAEIKPQLSLKKQSASLATFTLLNMYIIIQRGLLAQVNWFLLDQVSVSFGGFLFFQQLKKGISIQSYLNST